MYLAWRARSAPGQAAAGGGRWRCSAFPLVTQPVVEPAEQASVLLGGRPALGPGLDVVALAVLGRFVAVGVDTHAVPQLEGPARPTGEQAEPAR